jgi:hypothetical protein
MRYCGFSLISDIYGGKKRYSFLRNEWGGGVENRERRVESSERGKTGWKRT